MDSDDFRTLEVTPRVNYNAEHNVYTRFNSINSFGALKLPGAIIIRIIIMIIIINNNNNNKTGLHSKGKKHFYLFMTEFIVLCRF